MKMVGSSWSTLLLSKIDSACAASLEVFSKQRTLMVWGATTNPSFETGARFATQ